MAILSAAAERTESGREPADRLRTNSAITLVGCLLWSGRVTSDTGWACVGVGLQGDCQLVAPWDASM